MAFSRAPRHLFQLLPNGKAESADLRIRFDHLWTFVINGVEGKGREKVSRYYYSLPISIRPRRFLLSIPLALSILSQSFLSVFFFFFFLDSRICNSVPSCNFLDPKKRKKKKSGKFTSFNPQWINTSIQPLSYPMNIYEREIWRNLFDILQKIPFDDDDDQRMANFHVRWSAC